MNDTRVTVPEVHETQLRQTAGVIELKNEVGQFTAGNTIVNSYDVKTGRQVWLVAPTALLPRPPAILTVCGHDSTDTTAKRYRVFYADSVQSGKTARAFFERCLALSCSGIRARGKRDVSGGGVLRLATLRTEPGGLDRPSEYEEPR